MGPKNKPMNDENNVVADNLNTAEVVSPNENENDNSQNDESVDWKAKALEFEAEAKKKDELYKNAKIRAEKAEKKAKSGDIETKPDVQIPQSDFYALVRANVPEDDVSDVVDYAKLKGISITEALKTSFVKSVLAEKAEQRNSASAAHVGNARRSAQKISDTALVEKASKGELPESEEEITRLVRARKGLK